MSGQVTLQLGAHQAAFQQAAQRAQDERAIERIWARDYTLWAAQPDEISNRLGWLDIAERMRPEAAALTLFAHQLRHEGITHALLLGMGGSSLAPEVYSRLLPARDGIRLGVLDSTDPDYIRQQAEAYDPAHTLYIVSTKSGGTVETLSLFKYFYNQVESSLRGREAGAHFIAITDPGSSLAATAEEHGFRNLFLADANIGGRYSALSYFGLVPAALMGADLGRLLDAAMRAAAACRRPANENPGAQLGLALGALAAAGCDKATLLAPNSRAGFGDWAEQLIAESTGKNGKGILPIVGEPVRDIEDYGHDRVFIALGEQEGAAAGLLAAAKAAGLPVIEVSWADDYELGAQFFVWEFATALAGHVLGVHPFDQPDVEAAKVQGRAFVDEYTRTGVLPAGEQQPLEAGALRSFLEQAAPWDYVALQAYAAPSAALSDALQRLRAWVLRTQQRASTLGYGPRFLHSTGQLHKGDAGRGLFVQFVTQPAADLPIPNEAGSEASSLSFGVLKAAQALGDAAALRAAGRRVLSFAVQGDLAAQLDAVLQELG